MFILSESCYDDSVVESFYDIMREFHSFELESLSENALTVYNDPAIKPESVSEVKKNWFIRLIEAIKGFFKRIFRVAIDKLRKIKMQIFVKKNKDLLDKHKANLIKWNGSEAKVEEYLKVHPLIHPKSECRSGFFSKAQRVGDLPLPDGTYISVPNADAAINGSHNVIERTKLLLNDLSKINSNSSEDTINSEKDRYISDVKTDMAGFQTKKMEKLSDLTDAASEISNKLWASNMVNNMFGKASVEDQIVMKIEDLQAKTETMLNDVKSLATNSSIAASIPNIDGVIKGIKNLVPVIASVLNTITNGIVNLKNNVKVCIDTYRDITERQYADKYLLVFVRS